MDERRIGLLDASDVAEVARLTFTTVRKGGYDPQEVRLHLESVAREMAHLEARIRELQAQLAEALQRAANPVLDEATLASALGTQSAAILRSRARGGRPGHRRGPGAQRASSSPRASSAPRPS